MSEQNKPQEQTLEGLAPLSTATPVIQTQDNLRLTQQRGSLSQQKGQSLKCRILIKIFGVPATHFWCSSAADASAG